LFCQAFDVIVGDAHVAERAETGVDAVVQLVVGSQFVVQVRSAAADALN
jgi:hypothetical protein